MNTNKLKLLVENLLREADEDPSAALQNAFTAPSVEDFVSKFKTIASDPKVQAILKAGETDGDPNDEKVSYSQKQIKVQSLLPTQNEIGFDQSIENIITDQYGSLESILKGKADVGGPIVTYNGKYIIDGHHRWSQVFAANPKASMAALDIQGSLQAKEILKVVHAAIAVKVGKVPSSDPQGINILNGVTEKQVSDKVNEKLTDKAKSVWEKNGFKDNQAISNHIFKNLQTLISKNKPISGSPGRKDMPQTDYGDKSTKNTLDILSKGAVNFKEPKSSDVKELKRLQKLAGIMPEEMQQTDPEADKDAKQGLQKALNIIKSGTDSLKPSPKDGEIDELAGLLFGLIAGAPGLINLAGDAVNGIASMFQKDGKKGTVVGNALKHLGHEWEEAYIGAIGDALKAVYPESFGNQSVKDKTSQLYDAAHGIYAGILVGAAVVSGMGALDAHNLITKGLEGGLAAFKSSEVIGIAQKIAKAA